MSKKQFYDRIWRNAALRIGASVESLTDDILEIDLAGKKYFIERNFTPVESCASLRLAGSKPAVYRLLDRAGLPIAGYLEFNLNNLQDAKEFLTNRTPCVVKPSKNTGGGSGVTTGVMNTSQLRKAVVKALQYDSTLIIEEQVSGDNYRLLYLNSVLLDCIRRDPPTVIGDGQSTLAKLIKKENANRSRHGIEISQSLINVDVEMRMTLSRQKLTMSSVIKQGCKVKLKNVVNENRFSENKVVTREVCADVIRAGSLATELTGIKLAGVDIQTPDLTKPLESVGGVILEVNTTPGFYYHYNRDADDCDVAFHLLKDLKETKK